MARPRFAIVVLGAALALAGPSCRFSRGNDSADSTSTSASTIPLFDDTSTSVGEETTTSGGSATSRRSATTVRATAAATRATAARVVTTARPATTVPHCNASAANTTVGSPWSVSVTSTFPNAEVVIDIEFSGGAGNYSGVTDGSGSWTKTQPRASEAMRGEVNVQVRVANRVSCSTSFTVS